MDDLNGNPQAEHLLNAVPEDNSDHPHSIPVQNTSLGSEPPPTAKTDRKTQTCKPDQTPRWKIALEGLAVAVGMIAVYIYGRQLESLNRATNNSLKTEIAIQVPFIISPTSFINWNNTAPEGSPSIWVGQTLQNVGGGTRAVGAIALYGWGYDLPNPATTYQGSYSQEDSWIWVPNGIRTTRVIMPLEEARKAAEAVRLKQPFYAYDKIRYSDIFPIDSDAGHPRRDHLVESCIKIVMFDTGETTNGVSTKWRGDPCPQGGYCFDDTCPASDYKNYPAEK